jgi:hypothetical protein
MPRNPPPSDYTAKAPILFATGIMGFFPTLARPRRIRGLAAVMMYNIEIKHSAKPVFGWNSRSI